MASFTDQVESSDILPKVNRAVRNGMRQSLKYARATGEKLHQTLYKGEGKSDWQNKRQNNNRKFDRRNQAHTEDHSEPLESRVLKGVKNAATSVKSFLENNMSFSV